MINAVTSIIVIFLIFSVGFFLTYRNIWPQSTSSVLSVIVVKIAAPSLALISISDYFTPELLRQSAHYLLIVALYILMLYCTGKIFSKAFRLSVGKKQVFEVSFMLANAIFIGLPVNQLVFGQVALPYVCAFYLVNLAIFWSLGAHELSKVSPKKTAKYSIKGIINPGFIGVIAGCVLAATQFSIPGTLDAALRYLGALCVPLALLVIGANLVFFAKGFPKIHLDEWAILGAKFIISPLYMFILLSVFGVEGLAFRVFMLTATMPCHMQTSILAEFYEVESAYASKLVSISTLASLITIPFFASVILYIS